MKFANWSGNIFRSLTIASAVMISFVFTAHAQTTTNAVTLSNGLPDTGAYVIRVFGALILVIAVFFGGVWLFRNWQRFTTKKSGGSRLNLIEVKSLGQRQSLYVVGYQQQRMLLASTPTGITLVSHLPAADEKESEEPPQSKMSFVDAFQQVLTRKS